jgi:two-component system chemotaxis response regulator CheY
MELNVLVVDDSKVMRSMISKTMHMSGIPVGEIIHAGNGQEGLEALKDNWIDLVIADINMPIMNGEEMIRRMKDSIDTRDIPIMVVSTEGSKKRIERIVEKGVIFVHKPFTPEIFRDNIKAITGIGANNE